MKDISKIIAAMAISASGVNSGTGVEPAREAEEKQTNVQNFGSAPTGAYGLVTRKVERVGPDFSLVKTEIEEALASNFLDEKISQAG